MEQFPLGVIEGFYGQPWSWRDRHAQVAFLAQVGLGAYVYAPKADPFLRKRWREPWPQEIFRELAALAQTCRTCGVAWGIGLSPFELYRDYSAAARTQLRVKLAEIDRLQPDILCVLFDDMRGDLPDLAALQANIVHDIARDTRARQVIMCPSYYSFDPVLEKVFGPRPPRYWDELGARLDHGIGFFWTGDKVCSDSYSRSSIQRIAECMGRPPVLWDNYPVNDGASMSRRLHLQPFTGRPERGVSWLRGHLVNPMSQAWLSRLPLASLVAPGGGSVERFERAALHSCPPLLVSLLQRDLELFCERGLDGISDRNKVDLLRDYGAVDHPAAVEVCQWLRGEYAFDPACLTD